MSQKLPKPAVLLGIAGLIPFLLCGLLAVRGTSADAFWLMALLGYGAIMLGFLGGVHWGLALAPDAPARRGRLALAMAPILAGWLALLAAQLVTYWLGLAVLSAGYAAAIAIELRANREGLMPDGYLALRWGLSTVVVVVLLGTMALRLLGAHVVIW